MDQNAWGRLAATSMDTGEIVETIIVKELGFHFLMLFPKSVTFLYVSLISTVDTDGLVL